VAFSNGERLGNYEIVSLIGSGGMGDVYKAHDTRLGRDVAIKVSTLAFNERFEREGRAVAALNHPNICQLYDVGALPSGVGFLVMEHIEGERLTGPMPLDDALRVARQIALALEAAHDKGIVHRDLKPGNVVVRADGTVKVLDFGLAKVRRRVGDRDRQYADAHRRHTVGRDPGHGGVHGAGASPGPRRR
jgi:eukaryotic-like serine/threonine-protein kinase